MLSYQINAMGPILMTKVGLKAWNATKHSTTHAVFAWTNSVVATPVLFDSTWPLY